MNHIARIASLTLLLATATANRAPGATLDLSGFGWAADYGPGVDLSLVTVNDHGFAVRLRVTLDFTPGVAGSPVQPLYITFRQLSRTAVSNLIIEDETVLNNTGEPWTSYQFGLLTPTNHFAFDSVANRSFSHEPFATAIYTDGGRNLVLSDGLLPSGPSSRFLPGVTSGALYIDGNLTSRALETVIFAQLPNGTGATLPPPSSGPIAIPLPASGTLAMVGVAAACAVSLRTRRRADLAS